MANVLSDKERVLMGAYWRAAVGDDLAATWLTPRDACRRPRESARR